MDYLFIQNYNSAGFTIDGVYEDNVHFFKNTAKALNNAVKSQCSGDVLCIPTTTKIIIGAVSNKYAGWVTAYDKNLTPADHQSTLNELKADINSMTNNPDYSYTAGTMVWSLNADYAANLFKSENTAYVVKTILDGLAELILLSAPFKYTCGAPPTLSFASLNILAKAATVSLLIPCSKSRSTPSNLV